jgi:hypothetical protein
MVSEIIPDHQEQTIGPVLKANDDVRRLLAGLEELPGRRDDGSGLPVISRDGKQIPQFQERHNVLAIEGDGHDVIFTIIPKEKVSRIDTTSIVVIYSFSGLGGLDNHLPQLPQGRQDGLMLIVAFNLMVVQGILYPGLRILRQVGCVADCGEEILEVILLIPLLLSSAIVFLLPRSSHT